MRRKQPAAPPHAQSVRVLADDHPAKAVHGANRPRVELRRQGHVRHIFLRGRHEPFPHVPRGFARERYHRDPFRVGPAVFKVLNPAGQPRGLAAAGARHQCDGSGEDQCRVLVAFGLAHGATFDCPCQPRCVTGWPPTGNYHVRVHPQMW